MNDPVKYAWFSPAADERFGHVIYEGLFGAEVIATVVGSDPEQSSYRWPDRIYRLCRESGFCPETAEPCPERPVVTPGSPPPILGTPREVA